MKKYNLLSIPYILVSIVPILILVLRLLYDCSFNKNFNSNCFLWTGRDLRLLFTTLFYALCVTAANITAGTILVFSFWKYGEKLFAKFICIVLIVLVFPVCIYSYSWIKFINVLNSVLSVYIPTRGFVTSWFVHSLTFLPITVIILSGGLMNIDKDKISAARLLGTDSRMLLRIIPGVLKQHIFAAAMITLLLTLNEYTIPTIFSVDLYSLSIFVEYSSTLSASKAFLKGLPLMILEIGILILLLKNLKETFLAGVRNDILKIKLELPLYTKLFLHIVSGGFFFYIMIVFMTVLTDIDMWKYLADTFGSIRYEIIMSLSVCLSAAILSLPIMYLSALWLHKSKNKKLPIFLTLLPFVIPSPLIGTALINTWNYESFYFLYNSLFMPVLGIMIRFMPIGVLIILAGLKHLDQNLIDSAKILSSGPWKLFFKIIMPLLAGPLIAAFAFVFLFGLGELGVSIMVLPPGLTTLTIMMYNYLHYGAFEKVAGICFIMMMSSCLVAAIFIFLFGKRSINDRNKELV